MPRLFDLLTDNTKKELAANAQSPKKTAATADSGRPRGGDSRPSDAHPRKDDSRPRNDGNRPFRQDRQNTPDAPPDKKYPPRNDGSRPLRQDRQNTSDAPPDKKYPPRKDDSRPLNDGNRPFRQDRQNTPAASPDRKQAPPAVKNARYDKTPAPAAQPVTAPDFVAIDVETTGLDFKNDRVIEVGAVRFVGGKPEEEFSTFINAGVQIPGHISRMTHISNDDVRTAPRFEDIAMKLLEFIGSLPICGHQIEFDLTFINAELKRAGFPEVTPQVIDSVLLARTLFQRAERFSLKHVCDELAIPLDNAHRALHDAKASGMAAVRLIPMFEEQPLAVRQALAAFAPGSMFKTLAVRSLHGARYGINLKDGEPLSGRLPKIDTPESFAEVDPARIEALFSGSGGVDTGDIGKVVKGFTPRPAQKEMAVSVIHALNGNGILAAEAGTGTGKSLAYLVPAALHALKNNCRVIVSTHTRNLQDQLINNDLPAAAALCGKELRFAKLKGRNNYLCRSRFYKMLRGEAGSLSPRERGAVLPLVVWSQTTESGDIEEQTFFNPKWFFKVWNLISADSQDCSGRRCPYYSTCFLHRARSLAQTSHIVVINHALFYSDICSETSFLGEIGSIIFDEAHHLESSGHQHLRTELDTNRTTAFVDKLQNLLHTASEHKNAADVKEFEKELKDHLKQIRKRAQDLLKEIDGWASYENPKAEAEYEIAINEDSLRHLLQPAVFDITLGELQDTFHHFRQVLAAADKDKVEELREELSACAEQTSQMRADLQYLTAAKTEDHVFWVEGNHEKKWTKLCGVPLDISELLAQIWERCAGGIVFTSATLATQGSMDYFKRAAGLASFAGRTQTIVLPSPYSANQTLFGAFPRSPEPDNPAFAQFIADAAAKIHSKLGKNILVLFTSNAMLGKVYSCLTSREDVDQNGILAQGFGGNRNSMLEQFKSQSGMILLGTDSFWEGVDVPGESCEAVIIPRLPFPVPTHPLTQALGKRMEELYGSSFFNYSVPEAIIKFRQGAGRLIRSASDRGVLLVLDNRIVTKAYGKQFSRALESKLNEFESVDGMIEAAREFFESPDKFNTPDTRANASGSNITYIPFEDL